VYVKDGNVWRQSGKEATQLTTGGRDAMPSITPDGEGVLFVRYRDERGRWVAAGRERTYALTIPSLMRVPLGGGEPERLLDGRVTSGSRTWFGWIRQPVMSPDGKTIALLTDLPDPTRSNVTLHLYDLETEKLRGLDLPETVPLGHQDPEWRPDGKALLYVRNARDGARGTPRLYRLNPESGNTRVATNPGYLHPSYSPDGRFIAATRTSAFGTDIVILDASNGAELARVTRDDRSWAPVWSPRGDAIAFLHMQGQVVDLRMIELIGTGPDWTLGESLELTRLSGLDSLSRPDWFIPADQLPPPTPEPAESPAASSAGS
jgi:Tol biopolymer transport system component